MCDANVIISIDLKKYRIRIHRCTLAILENPPFVQLLVNPETMQIAVIGLDQKLLDAYKVKEASETDHCYELYSKSLVKKLRELLPQMLEGETYRFTGSVLQNKKIAVFPMTSLQRVDVSGGNVYGG